MNFRKIQCSLLYVFVMSKFDGQLSVSEMIQDRVNSREKDILESIDLEKSEIINNAMNTLNSRLDRLRNAASDHTDYASEYRASLALMISRIKSIDDEILSSLSE